MPTDATSTASVLDVAREGDVLVVTFDDPAAAVNTLGARATAAFAALLDEVERDATVRAVVLRSGKPESWIAGADIEQFAEIRTPADGERLSREGHALLARLETLRAPVVAAIHGACLGGGLEVALACAWRVATEHPKTVLALPEVQLGLIPGGAGTQRLPRLVGLQQALDMILTGKNVRARKALAVGLVDDLVHPAILREVAVRRARELAAGTRPRPARKHGPAAVLLEDNPLGRAVVFRQARERVQTRTRGHYPAPLAAIEVIQTGYADGVEAGLREEARRFGELAAGDVSRELVYLFHATTALKKDPGVEPAVEPRPVEKLAVIGAGFMGAGIAAVAALAGVPVRLRDADHVRVAGGLAAVRRVLDERRERRALTRLEHASRAALVTGTTDHTGFRRADLVVEAVFEDLALKRRVLADAAAAAPDAVLASNTSTIPIAEIARGAARPERVVGMHFFSPVHKMPLLEVVAAPASAPGSVATAVAFGRRLGKTVIVVRDGPGFYVNRILAPYLNEAGHLLDEGVAVDAIDRALVGFGFPVGPFTLIDEVGLDVAAKSGRVMADAFGDRVAPSPGLERVLASGRPGRKGGRGFYAYDERGKRGRVDESVYAVIAGSAPTPPGTPSVAVRVPATVAADEIVRRTVLPMLNEAVRCLEEGVLRSARDGDVGAVFGIGFPPFRGGPFRHLDALGAATVARELERLDARFRGRFAPAALLRETAAAGGAFHGPIA